MEMEVNPGVTDSLESFGFRSVRLPGRLGSIPTVAEGGCDRALVALSYVGLPWRGSDCLPEFTKISRDCHPLFSPRAIEANIVGRMLPCAFSLFAPLGGRL